MFSRAFSRFVSSHSPITHAPQRFTQLPLTPLTRVLSSKRPNTHFSTFASTITTIGLVSKTYSLSSLSPIHINHYTNFSTSSHMTSRIPNCIEYSADTKPTIIKTEAEWLAQLGPHDYQVLRQASTERRGAKYTDVTDNGTYVCKACAAPLFTSNSKFHSGCGWPSFDDAILGAVLTRTDPDGHRIEILCASCHSHLGHVFEGERFTPRGIRHCVNSCCLVLKEDEQQ